MESFLSHPLVTKIDHMSNIMPFYGYLHECACLFKRLGGASRNEWNSNLKAIVNVIMKDSERIVAIWFQGEFTMQMAEFLSKNHTYLLYKLEVKITTEEAGDALLFLLKVIDFGPPNLVSKMDLQVKSTMLDKVDKIFEKLINLGMDVSSLSHPIFNTSLEDTIFNPNSKHGIYRTSHKYSSLLKFMVLDSGRLNGLRENLKSVQDENLIGIEEKYPTEEMEGKVYLQSMSTSVNLACIKFSELGVMSQDLKQVSQNILSKGHAPIESCSKIICFMDAIHRGEVDVDEALSSLNDILKVVPKVEELNVLNSFNGFKILDIILYQSLSKREYCRLKQILTIDFGISAKISIHRLDLTMNNCDLVISGNGEIKVFTVKELKLIL